MPRYVREPEDDIDRKLKAAYAWLNKNLKEGNAPAGDLYLHIRLVPHPVFDVEGHNLLITVPLAPWDSALSSNVRSLSSVQGRGSCSS